MKRTELISSAETFGWNTLSNEELIAIAFNFNDKNIISRLSDYFSSGNPTIGGILNLRLGIKRSEAERLVALHSLFVRNKAVDKGKKVRMSTDLYQIIKPCFDNAIAEEVWLMLLDNASHVVKKIRISVGTFDCSLLDVRMIIKKCLEFNITTFAIAHNHFGDSVTVSPSMSDIKATQEIYRGAQLMRMRFIDHIIVADNAYYSFADEDKLNG